MCLYVWKRIPRCKSFSRWFKYFPYNMPQLRDANFPSRRYLLSLSQQQSSCSTVVGTSAEFTSWLSSLCTAGKPRWRVYSSMRFSGGMHLRLWACTRFMLYIVSAVILILYLHIRIYFFLLFRTQSFLTQTYCIFYYDTEYTFFSHYFNYY